MSPFPHRRLICSLTALLAACEPAPPPQARAVEAAPTSSAAQTAPIDAAQGAAKAPSFAPAQEVEAPQPLKLPWRWITYTDRARLNHTPDQLYLSPTSYKVEISTDEGVVVSAQCESCAPDDPKKHWRTALGKPFVPAATLAQEAGKLYVTVYSKISSGGQLIALDQRDGKILWRHTLKALGPQSHSQYLNEQQLYLDYWKGPLIYGVESSGCYIEQRYRESGELRDHQRVDCEQVKVPEQWPQLDKIEEPKSSTTHEDSLGQLSLSAVGRDTLRPEQFVLKVKGAHPWEAKIDAQHHTHSLVTADDDRVYAVFYHRIATGAEALAWDRKTGAQLWTASLMGVGSVGHSKYSNKLQALRLTPLGLEIHGAESAAAYVELLDKSDGRLLVNHRYYQH